MMTTTTRELREVHQGPLTVPSAGLVLKEVACFDLEIKDRPIAHQLNKSKYTHYHPYFLEIDPARIGKLLPGLFTFHLFEPTVNMVAGAHVVDCMKDDFGCTPADLWAMLTFGRSSQFSAMTEVKILSMTKMLVDPYREHFAHAVLIRTGEEKKLDVRHPTGTYAGCQFLAVSKR